jgi:hypothetical protein
MLSLAVVYPWGTFPVAASEEKATIKVVAVDSFGVSFGRVRITLFRNDAGTDFTTRFSGALGKNIPLGEYLIRIESEFGGPIAKRVVVRQPDCLLLIAADPMFIRYPPGHPPMLSGRIEPPPEQPSQVVWVKLCGVYLDGCDLSEVKADGSFTFTNLTPGSYAISVLGSPVNAMTEQVEIHNPGSVLLLYPRRMDHDRVEVSVPK